MKISIIVPVYNEEKLIGECLDALISQNYAKEDYEIVVVNDGSTDITLEMIKRKRKEAEGKNVEIKIVNLERNQGRVIAREVGAKNARYNNLLFIDSRCMADKDILENIKRIEYQPTVGNVNGVPQSYIGRIHHLIGKKLYHQYSYNNFLPIYITSSNFNKVPKGTTIFFCDKELFLSSQLENKSKNASDDTKLLWNIVQKKKILKHPSVKIAYLTREDFKEYIIHIFNRGPKFVDYYFDSKKKYFWFFIFCPIAALIFTIILVFVNPTYFLYWLGFLVLIWVFTSVWLAENIKDFFIVIGFLPIIGFSFEIGIFKGLFIKIIKIR